MLATAGKGTRFRPCIDLHQGKVKQIVGGTLAGDSSCTTNFVSPLPPEYYADLYRRNGLTGGHLIKLGGGNDEAARSALACWRGGLQIGGGITLDNAKQWLADGADKVIVTSWLFPAKEFSLDRLRRLSEEVGREKLVVDISCRKRNGRWFVAIDKWQTITDMEVNGESLAMMAPYCSEFLIHAADVEGLCRGIDEELVIRLGEWVTIPTTYAGGANNISDLQLVNDLSGGKVNLTFGSSLDIFGGKSVSFEQCVDWNRSLRCTQ